MKKISVTGTFVTTENVQFGWAYENIRTQLY